jgi:hypothetical protein
VHGFKSPLIIGTFQIKRNVRSGYSSKILYGDCIISGRSPQYLYGSRKKKFNALPHQYEEEVFLIYLMLATFKKSRRKL